MCDTCSLSHSKRRCRYHIIAAAKYRRIEIYGKAKAAYKVSAAGGISVPI